MESGKGYRADEILNLLPFVLVSIFPVLPNALQGIVFGLYLGYILLSKKPTFSKYLSSRTHWYWFIALTSFYLFSLGTFLFRSSLPLDLSIVRSNILLIIVPFFIVFLGNLIEEKRKLMIHVLVLSTFTYLCFVFWHLKKGVELSYILFQDEIDFGNYSQKHFWNFLLTNKFEYIYSLASWGYHKSNILVELNTHHAYISALLNLNVILLCKVFLEENERTIVKSICYLFSIAALFSIIVYIGSKVNIVFLGIFAFFLVYYLLKRVLNIKWILLGAFIIMTTLLILCSHKFNLNKNSCNPVEMASKVVDPERRVLYRKLLPALKSNLIFGVGINNVNPMIDSLMKSSNSIYHYNILTHINSAHSQFLFYQFSGGVINLVLFLAMFVFLLYRFYTSRCIWGFSFVILIAFNCIFEDFLNRAWGVYIYSIGLLILWVNKTDEQHAK